jgi:endonuclease/exonuclease/phosphatase family metal-dependent hydrolase
MPARKELMEFNILNWNIAGAKYLEDPCEKRTRFKDDLNRALRELTNVYMPDVVTLQEVVQYREPSAEKVEDIIESIAGYSYHPFVLIDTDSLSVRAKWHKLEKSGKWPKGTYFAQGNGFLFREGLPHQPVWDLPRDGKHVPRVIRPNYVEKVGLESGLYFGDRDTEPRAALVAHFVFNPQGETKPLDIFVINLHLTTLTTEREGVPEIDRRATRIRLSQLDVVFDGIVSRYNYWRRGGFRERGDQRAPEDWETFERHEPVWILTGDFNSTNESHEYRAIQGLNFMDVIKNKGSGTKAPGVGHVATLTLDYVFVGPAFVALDPLILGVQIASNHVVQEVRVSDHFPMVANIPIWGK